MKLIIAVTYVCIFLLILGIILIFIMMGINFFNEYDNKNFFTAIFTILSTIITLIGFFFKPSISSFIFKIFYLLGLKKLCISSIKKQNIELRYTKKDIEEDKNASHKNYLERIFFLYGLHSLKIKIKGKPYTLITNKNYDQLEDRAELLLREYKDKKIMFYIGE